MREIKFRGKAIDQGKHHGKMVHGHISVGRSGPWIDCGTEEESEWVPVDPETVGQFTTRKDIANEELYDGDIVVSDVYPIREEDGYVGVIEHDDGVFWLTRRLKNGSEARGMSDGIADYLYEHRDDNLKRIGNIYENSDLLLAPKEGADTE